MLPAHRAALREVLGLEQPTKPTVLQLLAEQVAATNRQSELLSQQIEEMRKQTELLNRLKLFMKQEV